MNSFRTRLGGSLTRAQRTLGRTTARLRRIGTRISRTSVTDGGAYLAFCARAAADPATFQSFRREPIYIETLEHVTEQQGAEYLRVIQRDSPHLLPEFLELCRANDRLGSPTTYEYRGIGTISPVTLRYLKVLSDLERHFGDLTDKRVIEIGVGYGGQCSLVLRRWRVHSYVLVDLEPALALARRYLMTLGVEGGLEFKPPISLVASDYDLCISNYAFSELTRDVQDRYARLTVSSSRRGYLTCNFISPLHGIDSWSRDELEHLHAGAHWFPEEPLTYQGNEILVWGDGDRSSSAHRAPGV